MARHFTKDEIEEIRVQLATKAVRDSDLPEAETLYDEDELAIVQGGYNKRLSAAIFQDHLIEIVSPGEEERRRNERIRQQNEEERQENEATRQGNENGTNGRVANERTRQQNESARQQNEAARQQGEQNRNTAYATAEGTKSGSTASDGSRWGEYKAAENERNAARLAAEGTIESLADDGTRWGEYKEAEEARDTARAAQEGSKTSSTKGDGTMWGEYKQAESDRDDAYGAQEGTSSSVAGSSNRWGAYKTAEASRDTTFGNSQTARTNAYNTAEGTSSSTAGDGSRWGAYKTAEASRDTQYTGAEGTQNGSVAGDGTRWGTFKTNEASRDQEVQEAISRFDNTKADKDADAVDGNAAMFDSNGNPVDGGTALSTIVSGAEAGATAYQKPGAGIPKADLADAVQTSLEKADTAVQDVSGKANKSEMSVTPGTGADADKTTIQLKSGTSATVLKTHQNISGKADKVTGATAGNFAGLDANGNLVDSGKSATDLATAVEAAQAATEAAESCATYMSELEDAIEALPDGQAVSATVAQHTVDIANLDDEISQLGQEVFIEGQSIEQLSHSFERTYNLWNELWEIGSISSVDGTNSVKSQRIRTIDYIPVLPNTHYRLNCSTDCYVFCYNDNKEYINLYFQGAGIDILTRQDCYYIRFSPVADYGTEYNGDIAFYQGTEVKPYIPYLCAKDTIAREKSTKNETDISNINLFLKNNIGYEKTSENYSATEYYMLQNLGIISGQIFRVKFNISGSFSRIILCANGDNSKRLIDSNDVNITDGKWFEIVAPYNIAELGCFLSVGSGSAVGITLDVFGDTVESILKVEKDVQNLVGYLCNSTIATETDYWMMQELDINQGQGLYVKFNISGTFSRIILCANTDNTIRLIDSNQVDIVGGEWYYVVAPVQINTLGCWLSLSSGSSVQFDVKVLQEIGGQTIKDKSISREKFDSSVVLPTKKLIMLGNGVADTYKVKFKYSDTENMIISFERFGVNNFLHPHYIYKEAAQELTTNFTNNLTQYLYNGTDWVSPYAYCEATSYAPVENPFTVGGHHGTEGTGGFPTMEVASIDVYADGVKITDFSNFVHADEIKIVTKSNISACNRINLSTGEKETSFIETVVWTITENNIEVCTYLKAVEAIQIGAYVGLQMSEVYSSGEESVYFNDGHGKYYNNGSQHNSESLPFNGNRMMISKDGVDDIIVVYTNRTVGLGDLSNIGISPVMYMASFGKCYAHLVQTSNPLVLGIGDVAYYSGGYTFAKTYSCPNAENAYFYKLNGKKVYCVDFLASGDSFVSVPEIEYGKQVEVVKNDNVTIDEIVSGNGIHVKSSGIGNVEFTIK